MCGRARLSSDVSEIKLVFGIPPERPTPNFPPSWNVAPTDPLPVVRTKGELILMEGTPNAAGAAEDLFLKALDWAHRQGVRSWALRAATSGPKRHVSCSRRFMASLPRGSRRPISKRQNRWSTICHGCKTDTASSKMRI
jgi:hypothetical protein